MSEAGGAFILGLGLALPPGRIRQAESAAMARRILRSDETGGTRIDAIYRKSGVLERGSVLIDAASSGLPVQRFFVDHLDVPAAAPPSTGARLREFEERAPPLAEAAARAAMERSQTQADQITDIIAVSCTGMSSPGIDTLLIQRLGLRPTTRRTSIGFMGCHGAVNGLRVARGLIAADPEAVVLLVCIELCSIHFDHSDRPEAAVANALFADGAAACVVGSSRSPGELRIAATASCLIPETAETMSWRVGDQGFEMRLSPRVPGLIKDSLRPWLSEWLGNQGVRLSEIGGWAIHPGGPRVLDAAASALDLPSHALAASREVLAAHGNMSSPTVLFILDRLPKGRGPVVVLAFGPGLVAEAALLV